jgi:hypothetical protein
MPSPFPGMNPYLEQPDVWHEFHEAFCGAIMTELSRSLPEPYYVRGDATVYVREWEESERHALGRPDAFVSGPAGSTGASAATLVAPARTVLPEADTFTETTIEIHDSRRRRVVTAIEVLSPSNKDPNDDYRRYATKRLAYLHSGASLVEIDLLRGGTRPRTLKPLPSGDYFVLVARPDQHPEAGVWPIALRQPLPKIPIPLAPPDADVLLDLQQMLHAAFDARSFRKFIYEAEPAPPLSKQDAEWARSVLIT